MDEIEEVVFLNAIDKWKNAKATCKEIEAYEIVCSLLKVNPDGVSQSRLQNVDAELSTM